MTARREPLLWLQLLGLAALPAECLGVGLILAGADPGRAPGLERLLLWCLGGLLPAVLLWRRPADIWSLLLLRTPLRGRREQQRRLSAMQSPLLVKGIGAGGALLLVPAVWSLDGLAPELAALTPLGSPSRLVVLLLAIPVVALLLWQWQQAVQALWLLSRPEASVAQATPLSLERASTERLSLGLPLLLPEPLKEPPQPSHEGTGSEAGASAVTPEQGPEQSAGPELNDQVP